MDTIPCSMFPEIYGHISHSSISPAASMAIHEQLPSSVGDLRLDLQAKSYTAGDTLRGCVSLTLNTPVEDTLISVVVRGTQRVDWVEPLVPGYHQIRRSSRTAEHFKSEFYVGPLNGTLASGVHDLPFTFELPVELITASSVEGLLRKQVDKVYNARITVDYTVTAQLEVAGLSNPKLQSESSFLLVPQQPQQLPPASPISVVHTEEVKKLGMGHSKPCTMRMNASTDVFQLQSGLIQVDVEIDLPAGRKLSSVRLGLHEDVALSFDEKQLDASRAICSEVFKACQFVAKPASENSVSATLQLPITDPGKAEFGALAPSLASHFLQIRHRLVLDCSLSMGGSVELRAPITLV